VVIIVITLTVMLTIVGVDWVVVMWKDMAAVGLIFRRMLRSMENKVICR
jgi:hypothetical protein